MNWMVRGALLGAAAMLCACGAGAASEKPMSEAAQRGQVVFEQNCAQCHTLAESNSTAPTLRGVVGRKVGAEHFTYSPALKSADFVWTEQKLGDFLAAPYDVLPDNQMAFYGIEDKAQRDDLVAYLAHEKP